MIRKQIVAKVTIDGLEATFPTNTGNVTIKGDEQGVEIYLEGHGVKTQKGGAPIYIDTSQTLPCLYVWGDINEEEPTHKIELDKTLEFFYLRMEDNNGKRE